MAFASTGLRHCAKFLLVPAVIFFVLGGTLRAVERPQVESAGHASWVVEKSGEARGDGFSTPAVLKRNERPDRETYLPQTLIIKTRTLHTTPKDAQGFLSQTLQASLQNLAVTTIRTPFPRFNNGDALARDAAGVGRIHEISYASDLDAWEAAQLLEQNPDIEYAEPVYRRYSTFTPNDPRFANQYHLARIEAEKAWDITTGNPNVVVAIIDSGTDYEHEDLADNIYVNLGETPGNGRDDDNNGYIDDVIGWDFVGDVTSTAIFSGAYRPDNDPKVRGTSSNWANDRRNHGTVVAGCVAANTHNNTGIAAIGYNTSLMPIKCGSDNANVRGIFRGYEAILYAAENGADIINCSWGGYGRMNSEQDVIDQANALGALVVVSSGNEGYHTDLDVSFYPANYDGVFNIGASNANDRVTGFSNFGAVARVYAPGASVWSTAPEDNYTASSGTSFSSPIVSGIAALVKAQHPTWTPMQIMHQIRSTSDDVFSNGSEDARLLYYGRANAYRAVELNASFSSGSRIPGISHEELLIQTDSGLLDSFDETTMRLVIRNYLGTANGLSVEFRSLDGYVDFTNAPINVGTLQNDRTRNVDVNLKLKSSMPWSTGYLDVMVIYRATDYVDFERLRVPVGLPGATGGNLRFPGTIVSDLTSTVWHSGSSPDGSSFWFTGQTRISNQLVGICGRASQGGFQAIEISQGANFPSTPTYSISGIDAFSAWVSTNAAGGGGAAVWRTTNGGNSWGQVSGSLDNITAFINDIYFFDQQNGVILGDPINGNWGVATSSDGGQTWTRASDIGFAVDGEAGLVGASTQLGDNVWFGTSTGRVFYSTTQGRTWKSSVVFNGKQITSLAFRTPEDGVAVYREQDEPGGPFQVASTHDGGDSWELAVYDLDDIPLQSVFAYGAPESLQNFILGDGGQLYATADDGESFEAVLTPTIGPTQTGAMFSDGNNARLWRVHTSGVSYADFQVVPIPEPKLTSIDRTQLSFGAVDVGTTESEDITISSLGTEAVTLDISVVDEESYSFAETPPTMLASGEDYVLTVQFHPTSRGLKNSTLIITSDGGSHEVSLSGRGIEETTSVADVRGIGMTLHTVSPSPAQSVAVMQFELDAPMHARLEVIDLRGRTLLVPFDGQADAGTHELQVDVRSLSAGVYMLRLSTPQDQLARSFVIGG